MFATTEPEKVLVTILSRCQRFDLRRIPSALIVRELARIAALEKVTIGEAALFAIARGADGGMRDAESTLDQLISFCGSTIEEPDVLSMFGLTAQGQILDLSKSILAGDIERALRHLDELAKHGKDLGRLLSDLLGHFRNLLLFQVTKGDRKLLEVSEAEAEALLKQSATVGLESLTAIMEVLTNCEVRLRDSASPRILIEVALLQAIEARKAVSIDSVIQHLKTLRDQGNVAPSTRPGTGEQSSESATLRSRVEQNSRVSSDTNSGAETAALVSESAATGVNLEELWSGVVDAVGRASPFIRGYLLEAHPVSFDAKLLTIGFYPEFADHLDLVDNAKNRTVIQTKLKELGHGEIQVKFVKAESPARKLPATSAPIEPVAAPEKAVAVTAPTPPAGTIAKARVEPVPISKDDFKNDPLIQKALEIFKGQIVEVRA
jgi:DNA polymerase-3 subunit gamma/tau